MKPRHTTRFVGTERTKPKTRSKRLVDTKRAKQKRAKTKGGNFFRRFFKRDETVGISEKCKKKWWRPFNKTYKTKECLDEKASAQRAAEKLAAQPAAEKLAAQPAEELENDRGSDYDSATGIGPFQTHIQDFETKENCKLYENFEYEKLEYENFKQDSGNLLGEIIKDEFTNTAKSTAEKLKLLTKLLNLLKQLLCDPLEYYTYDVSFYNALRVYFNTPLAAPSGVSIKKFAGITPWIKKFFLPTNKDERLITFLLRKTPVETYESNVRKYLSVIKIIDDIASLIKSNLDVFDTNKCSEVVTKAIELFINKCAVLNPDKGVHETFSARKIIVSAITQIIKHL